MAYFVGIRLRVRNQRPHKTDSVQARTGAAVHGSVDGPHEQHLIPAAYNMDMDNLEVQRSRAQFEGLTQGLGANECFST